MLDKSRRRSSSISRSRVASAPVSMSSRAAASSRAASSSGSLGVAQGDLHDVRPVPHPADREVAGRVHLGERSEVREKQDRSRGRSDAFDRGHVLIEVELGWWRRRPEHGQIGNVDPERVPGECRAGPGVDERDVMRCVTWRVEDLELAVTHPDQVAVAERSHASVVHGLGWSEELPHLPFTPDASGARDESGWVDQVGRASLVDPHGCAREALGELTDSAGMVQVDVGEDDVGERARFDPQVIEGRGDRLDRCSGAGLDEGRFGGVEEVGGGVARPAPHEGVDRPDAVGDGEHDGWALLHRASLAGECR